MLSGDTFNFFKVDVVHFVILATAMSESCSWSCNCNVAALMFSNSVALILKDGNAVSCCNIEEVEDVEVEVEVDVDVKVEVEVEVDKLLSKRCRYCM